MSKKSLATQLARGEERLAELRKQEQGLAAEREKVLTRIETLSRQAADLRHPASMGEAAAQRALKENLHEGAALDLELADLEDRLEVLGGKIGAVGAAIARLKVTIRAAPGKALEPKAKPVAIIR